MKGGHRHGPELQAEMLSAPVVKMARIDEGSPDKSSANGGGRTVHTMSAEDQADNFDDENFQVGLPCGEGWVDEENFQGLKLLSDFDLHSRSQDYRKAGACAKFYCLLK